MRAGERRRLGGGVMGVCWFIFLGIRRQLHAADVAFLSFSTLDTLFAVPLDGHCRISLLGLLYTRFTKGREGCGCGRRAGLCSF